MMLSPKYSDRLTIIESLVRLVSLHGYTEIPARIFFSKMIEFSKALPRIAVLDYCTA
jgi:hypothetical protein